MYSFTLRIGQRMALLCLLLLVAAPVWAQRTGDHIVPAIETVCDGDPFSFGLCNSYCEAHDCDSETPIGTPRSCANVLKNYMKKSGGLAPPCEATCPCEFNVEADFATLVVTGNAEFEPSEIDVLGTYQEYCGQNGPDGEDSFVAEAFEPEVDLGSAQGVRLFYWVDSEGATCNEVGGGLDGNSGPISPNNLHYAPLWIDRTKSLSPTELANCQFARQQVCP